MRRISEVQRLSIDLAVAQYLRSANGVRLAQQRLARFHLDDAELLRRRRADASDAATADILKFAVTVAIARGRMTARDRRILGADADREDVVREIVLATGAAYTSALLAESNAADPTAAGFDMDVGDY